MDNIRDYISGYDLGWTVENYGREGSDESVLIKDKGGKVLIRIPLDKIVDGEQVNNVIANAPQWMEKINGFIADQASEDVKKRVAGKITFDSNTSAPSGGVNLNADDQ